MAHTPYEPFEVNGVGHFFCARKEDAPASEDTDGLRL